MHLADFIFIDCAQYCMNVGGDGGGGGGRIKPGLLSMLRGNIRLHIFLTSVLHNAGKG